MKLIKIEDEYFNSAAIVKISRGQVKIQGADTNIASLHFADGKNVVVSEDDLGRLFEFVGKEEIEIKEAPRGDWEIL